jgi:hypothetical protein
MAGAPQNPVERFDTKFSLALWHSSNMTIQTLSKLVMLVYLKVFLSLQTTHNA